MPQKKQFDTEPTLPVEDAPQLPDIEEDSLGDAADQRREVGDQESETNVVRYVGVFSERTVSREDWETAGVPDQEGVTWTKDRLFVPIEHFSEEALRMLSTTGEFQIVRDDR